ncbi:MAG: hypothetical protein AAFN79_20125 [Pseudomonadota bacterium]
MSVTLDPAEMIVARILAEIESRPESAREIAKRAGLNERYFSGLRRNPSNMTMGSFLRVCRELDLDPSSIANTSQSLNMRAISDSASGDAISAALPEDATLDRLLDQWADADGEVEKIETDLLRYVVLFKPPRGGAPVPHKLGRKSFTAELLEDKTVSGLRNLIDNSQKMLVETVASSHFQALQGKPILTVESGKIVWSDGVSASVDYVRLLLPVKDAAGRYFVLSYSKQIGTRQKPAQDPGE